MRRLLAATLLAATLAGCGGDDGGDGGDGPVTLRLVTHDSFALSEDVLAAFTEETGIRVRVVKAGDAGAMINQAILTKGDPLGDVLFGVDNTFLSRALDEDLFVPYESPALDEVPDEYELDDEHRVTPVDHGEVCVNYDKERVGTAAPSTLDDLADPRFKGQLVVENPATSSPGLAFLLATIAEFGEDGWQAYWERLKANDVQVVAGWEEAYNGSFSGGSGQGDKPLVVSYASSPPAEVHFADPPPAEAPTGVAEATCFRQVELVGILAGTEHEDEAGELVDFLLSTEVQADIPLQMFVFPVRDGVELPEVFTKWAARPDEPYELTIDEIGANRERWIEQWTDLVLG